LECCYFYYYNFKSKKHIINQLIKIYKLERGEGGEEQKAKKKRWGEREGRGLKMGRAEEQG
jgi:hypothetical protein